MKIYTKHNIVHHDPEITDDQVMVYVGSPSSSTTPYDVYARYIVKDAKIALMRRRLKGVVHTCHRRIAAIHHGSGPEGQVRFGDDMIPPDIYVVVDKADETKTIVAIHDYRLRRYLHKPVSISGDLWWNKNAAPAGTLAWYSTTGAWVKGGTWSHVVDNAVFIAQTLGKETTKLEEYRKRRAQRHANNEHGKTL